MPLACSEGDCPAAPPARPTAASRWRAVAGDVAASLGVTGGGAPDDWLDARDPEYIRRSLPAIRAWSDLYFRAEVSGLDEIRADEPVLLVGNHSGGTLIADTFVFAQHFYDHFGPSRRFHQLAHDLVFRLPGLRASLSRFGTVPANPDNMRSALDRAAALLVYPGGDHETYRPSCEQADGGDGELAGAQRQARPPRPLVGLGGEQVGEAVAGRQHQRGDHAHRAPRGRAALLVEPHRSGARLDEHEHGDHDLHGRGVAAVVADEVAERLVGKRRPQQQQRGHAEEGEHPPAGRGRAGDGEHGGHGQRLIRRPRHASAVPAAIQRSRASSTARAEAYRRWARSAAQTAPMARKAGVAPEGRPVSPALSAVTTATAVITAQAPRRRRVTLTDGRMVSRGDIVASDNAGPGRNSRQ